MFHNILRETAKQYPASPAIVWQGGITTYAELDRRSDEVAAELSSSGVTQGDIVPVTLPRGAEWIAYTIGVMKVGAAYAPLSPSLPPERMRFLLKDMQNNKAPEGAIAIYYTSGSTGEPKGAILTHDGVTAFCKAHAALAGLSHGVRGGVQADVGFDSFLLSTLPILYSGGTLYLMEDVERMSLVGIHRFLIKHKIETVFFTTPLAVEYMRTFDNKHMKTLFLGGEALRTFTPRSYDAFNLYGPTECTAYITAHKLRDGESGDIPIGTPIGKTRVYIIDGELCVSGPQVAAGYLGGSDKVKFTQNPNYSPEVDEACYATMYKTGDLAEWADNGELLYRGRIDNQVKISGYRIEPGEVEIALAKHPDLQAVCVVVKHGQEGDSYLAAYCVSNSSNINQDELKAFLSQSLPAYMIPRKIILLDKLPVNARTGKVDTSALPEP